MQIRLLAVLCLALCYSPLSAQKYLEMIEAGTYPLKQIQAEAEAYFKVAGRERGSGYKPYKRWEYVAQMELNEQGVKIPNVELSQQARSYRQAEKLRQQAESNFSFGGDWKQLGPTSWNATSSWSPGLGRITSVGIDESNTNHLIVGSPTGGVWKTLNGGNTWTPLTDDFATVDVYALEISPYNNQQYLWGSTSGKIFRSTDGGATWASTSNVTGNGKVIRILYHPTDPNVVYATSESNGLFRSTNSGSTWTAVSGASGVPGYDVEFKPGDPSTIYFSGILMYRSTNGGSSFSQITGLGTANNNYKMIGVSPANPSIVYVLESNGGRFGGFYKSTDSGASFSKLIDGAAINYFGYSSTGDDDKGQAPRDMDIAVHPETTNEIHISGVHTWKSTNGGNSFSLTSHWIPGTAASLGVGYNHADVGFLRFVGNTLYVGTDGGFFISTDGAASFQNKSVGLAIREFYKIGVSKTNPNVVCGGSQDNGTSVMRTNNRTWVEWIGADGMETFVDWNNASILYGTSQYGSMYRSTNQGNTQSGISKPLDVGDGAWVTPFEQDPQVANTIYVAFEDVWKSVNSGNSWTKISNFDNGNMNQMKLAPSDNKRIYVSRGANLYTTADGGNAWTPLPSAWGTNSISYLSVHPTNPQRLLVVTSSTVYHSADAGATWTNIGTGLPSGTKYCATWENTAENGIYVGGFGFVSYTNDDLNGQWVGFFNGLPTVRVYELEINYVSKTIFAGTYGRGLWESPLYHLLPPATAFNANVIEGCRELTVTFSDESANNPSTWEWTFEGGTPATSNLQNPTVTFSGAGRFDVRLTSSNDAGTNTLEKTDFIVLNAPTHPIGTDALRCDTGQVSLTATGQAGEQINWYADATDTSPLFTGNEWTTQLNQTTAYYVSAGFPYVARLYIGPNSSDFGTGGNHAGDQFLIFNAEKPFRLKSALVYASGEADRVFRLRDANGMVLLEKTVTVPDGQSRVQLDMDIPQGVGLQIGCPGPANLFRNNSGPNYPYTLDGLMQITGSTAGADYYYYLYDIEVETNALCESERVVVTGNVQTPLLAPHLLAQGSTTLCPGDSVLLSVDNACPDCIVTWSNGETGPSIVVSSAGLYTATQFDPAHPVCGASPVSEALEVVSKTVPAAPVLLVNGPLTLCPGDSVELLATNVCPDCLLSWSTSDTTATIRVATSGLYSATAANVCGQSEAAAPIEIFQNAPPQAPTMVAGGSLTLCPGESVELSAESDCPDCFILWSTGDTTSSLVASAGGLYSAIAGNACGLSQASASVEIINDALPTVPSLLANGPTALCPGASVVLSVENVCPGCQVLWSTGDSLSSITVTSSGVFTAVSSNHCGLSPAAAPLEVSALALPETPVIVPNGNTILCPGDTAVLSLQANCPDCSILWSTGETTPSISVFSQSSITASLGNVCGSSPVSAPIEIFTEWLAAAPQLSLSGDQALCPGDSLSLEVLNDVCPACTVHWSNGQTGWQIYIHEPGVYWAAVDLGGFCGDGPMSDPVTVSMLPPFAPTLLVDNLCHISAPDGSDYQWFLDGVAIPNANAQEWSALTSGQYSVSMSSLEDCTGQSEPVFVEACISHTVQLEGVLSASLYPNPARQRVFLDIQSTSNFPASLELYAADGRWVGQLYSGDIMAGRQTLELALPELPAGVYQYRLVTSLGHLNGSLCIQKP